MFIYQLFDPISIGLLTLTYFTCTIIYYSSWFQSYKHTYNINTYGRKSVRRALLYKINESISCFKLNHIKYQVVNVNNATLYNLVKYVKYCQHLNHSYKLLQQIKQLFHIITIYGKKYYSIDCPNINDIITKHDEVLFLFASEKKQFNIMHKFILNWIAEYCSKLSYTLIHTYQHAKYQTHLNESKEIIDNGSGLGDIIQNEMDHTFEKINLDKVKKLIESESQLIDDKENINENSIEDSIENTSSESKKDD